MSPEMDLPVPPGMSTTAVPGDGTLDTVRVDADVLPNLDDLVIEDGRPVESIFMERQQRLLTEPLYTSWEGPGEGRPFLALANVGLFYAGKEPPLVPDVLLAVDVRLGDDVWERENRSYFAWVRG